MSEQLFDIYFRGEILDGFTVSQCHQNIAQLFKASPEKVQLLFSGKVVALKKGLDKPTALKFQQALKNAGVKIYIKQAQADASAQADTSAQAAPQAPQARTAPQESPVVAKENPTTTNHDADDSLILLPPGSDVLTEDEREHIEIPDIDTSNIHLSSAFDAPAETPKPAPAAPDVSHITAAAVGADILEGVEKAATKPAPDTSHIHLGQVGEDLLPEKEDVVVSAPDTSSIKLAEVGADMDPSEKKTPPPAPDTSHIKLEP